MNVHVRCTELADVLAADVVGSGDAAGHLEGAREARLDGGGCAAADPGGRSSAIAGGRQSA